MDYPVLAGDALQTAPATKRLFTGDLNVNTDSAICGATALAQYQVVALLPDDTLVPFDTDTHEAKQAVITLIAGVVGKRTGFYNAGHFNHALLVWPAALDTYAKRKQFFSGTNIAVGHLVP